MKLTFRRIGITECFGNMPMMLVVIVVLSALFQVSNAKGTLTFKLVKYEAIGESRKNGGTPCDSGDRQKKICDPYFMICLDPHGKSQCLFLISSVFRNTLTETFDDLQALVYPFESLPSEYEVELILRDQDASPFKRDQSQPMGEVTHKDYVVYGTTSVTVETTNYLHRVTFEISVHCDEFYYGDCSHYCKPSDNYITGHYTCDDDGYPVCRYGYIGPDTYPPCIASSRPKCTPTNPCRNSGVCSEDGPGKFKCDCSGTGFKEPTCSMDINECALAPCVNGGTCVNSYGSYSCSCLPANTGLRCEGFVDLCVTDNTCQNGATCHLEDLQQISCVCPQGYSGSRCELNVNECAFNPCVNGGTCFEMEPPSFTCVCPLGFSGSLCDIANSPCASDPCQNGGTCTNNGPFSFLCACPTGYTGSTCNVDIDDCASSPCANGGRCTDVVGGFVCCCLDGFSGNRCTDTSTTIDLRALAPGSSLFRIGFFAYQLQRRCPQIRFISYYEVVVRTAQDRVCLASVFA